MNQIPRSRDTTADDSVLVVRDEANPKSHRRRSASSDGSHTLSDRKSSDEDTDLDSEHDLNQPQRKGTLSKSFTASEERGVVRKLDRRLTLFLTFLYLLSFLDRSNIGNARIAGLQSSLGITSSQFDLTLLAFYITYITFEWMILLYRLVPAHIYIACCVFAWGLVACMQSTVTSFGQLLALRAALGITEAAFGPGVPFYMTFFYKREELAYRVGLQISAAPLATSFASALAWVIVKLSENGPLESWRALFLFEGLPSLVTAIFAFYLIPDSPSQARWFTPRERKIATLRLQGTDSLAEQNATRNSNAVGGARGQATGSASTRLSRSELLGTLADPKSWATALMFLSVNVSFASLPVFLPTIINSMSFSPLTSQILASPPYLVAFAFVLLVGHFSDAIPNSRGIFLISCASLSCASYSVIAIVGSMHERMSERLSIVARYAAVYGAACGLFASVVLIITWTLNNQQSTTGKGMGMVILNVVGQCGPLIGVELFPGEQGPFFVRGMSVCAGFMGAVAVIACGLRWYLGLLNKRGRMGGNKDDAYTYEMVGLRETIDNDGNENLGSGLEGEDPLMQGYADDSSRHRPSFRYML